MTTDHLVPENLLEQAGTEVSLSGRFRLVPASEMQMPAKCVICGSHPSNDEGPKYIASTSVNEEFQSVPTGAGDYYLDGSLVFEWYGSVYYCQSCTVEMSGLFGCLGPDLTRDLVAATVQLISQRDALLLEVEQLKESNNVALAAVLRSRGILSLDNLVAPDSVEPEVPETTPEIEPFAESDRIAISEGLDSEIAEREPEISEPVTEQRPDDIFDTTDAVAAAAKLTGI